MGKQENKPLVLQKDLLVLVRRSGLSVMDQMLALEAVKITLIVGVAILESDEETNKKGAK